MDDRLKELQTTSGCRSKSVFSDRCSVAESLLSLIMEKNNDLRACLDELEQSTANIDKMTKQVILATSPKVEQDLSTRILEVSAGAKMKITKTKDVLDFLRTEQKELPTGSPPADVQMLSNVINSNSRRFKTLLQDYLRSQENYKVEVQRKTQRQLRIAYPGATEEALQQLATNTEGAREAVQRQRQTGGTQNIESVLHDIENKYKSLKELESNVSDLHDLFVYLGTLVDNQQDVIDSIEASVWNTEEYVTKGQKDLLIAKKNQMKYESKKICMYVLLGLVIISFTLYLANALGMIGQKGEVTPFHQPVVTGKLVVDGAATDKSFVDVPTLGTCECADGHKGVLTQAGCDCSKGVTAGVHPHQKHYHLKGSKTHHYIALEK